MLVRRHGVHVGVHGLRRAHRLRKAGGATHVVIDVDGCMTDGRFALDMEGNKISKMWGADDSDAITWARGCGLHVAFVTADRWGFEMAKQRAAHMKVDRCSLMTPEVRMNHIASRVLAGDRIVYIGDGFYDWKVFEVASFGIAPAGALQHTRSVADATTTRCGGDRAVAQALTFTTRWLMPR